MSLINMHFYSVCFSFCAHINYLQTLYRNKKLIYQKIDTNILYTLSISFSPPPKNTLQAYLTPEGEE